MSKLRIWDIAVSIILTLIAATSIISTVLPLESFDASKLISSAALVFSLLSTYLTVFRNAVRQPQLKSEVNIQRSESTQANVKPSMFLRLQVENTGFLPAKKCVGRLIEVQNSARKTLPEFDPLCLYWARQARPDEYESIDIQGHGDFYYLDVAQANENTNFLDFRVVIPDKHTLPISNEYPGAQRVEHGYQMPKGTYYLYIGIYAEDVYIKPVWYKVEWEGSHPPDIKVA